MTSLADAASISVSKNRRLATLLVWHDQVVMSQRSRARVRLKCGEYRFPRSTLPKVKSERSTLQLGGQTCVDADDDTRTLGYSPKVLIHGWERRLVQVLNNHSYMSSFSA